MSTEITDPEVLAFIEKTNNFYPPNTIDLAIAEQRQVYDEMCAAFSAPRPEGLTVTDETLDGPDGAIPVRRYVPERAGRVKVVYFHGGGFIQGGLDSHDGVCAEISSRIGCTVISVDYRLCPEHIHPAAYNDALAATRAVLATGPVVLVGDSAGGNLAAAVAQTLRGEAIRGQVLIYPGLGGDRLGMESYEECAETPMLSRRDVEYYRTTRAGGDVPEDDPTFAPLVEDDLTGVPPCFISVAGVDPLRDDGVEYDRLLVGAGVEAYCVVEPKLPHGHLRARHMSRRAGAAFDRVVDAIRDYASRVPQRQLAVSGMFGKLRTFFGSVFGRRRRAA